MFLASLIFRAVDLRDFRPSCCCLLACARHPCAQGNVSADEEPEGANGPKKVSFGLAEHGTPNSFRRQCSGMFPRREHALAVVKASGVRNSPRDDVPLTSHGHVAVHCRTSVKCSPVLETVV